VSPAGVGGGEKSVGTMLKGWGVLIQRTAWKNPKEGKGKVGMVGVPTLGVGEALGRLGLREGKENENRFVRLGTRKMSVGRARTCPTGEGEGSKEHHLKRGGNGKEGPIKERSVL